MWVRFDLDACRRAAGHPRLDQPWRREVSSLDRQACATSMRRKKGSSGSARSRRLGLAVQGDVVLVGKVQELFELVVLPRQPVPVAACDLPHLAVADGLGQRPLGGSPDRRLTWPAAPAVTTPTIRRGPPPRSVRRSRGAGALVCRATGRAGRRLGS